MVYLPLGAFALGAVLVVLRVISGGAAIAVGLLGVYGVIPARALIETKRKGLALPKPPGAKGKGDAKVERPKSGTIPRRRLAAQKSERRRTSSAPAGSPRPSSQIMRRRALAGIVGIGALLLIGGILVIVGIGRVTSSLGLVMVGVGGFLMILSVTLPTFRLVDAVLRGMGRLLSRRKPAPARRPRSAKESE